MLRAQLLKHLCFHIVLLEILNQAATFFHWYTLIWWFDMPMHFLGGISVLYLGALVWRRALRYVSPARFLYESIITGFLLGVLWEAFELFLFLHYGSPYFGLLDSFSDLCFDLAGILFAAFMVFPLVTRAPEVSKTAAPVVS